MHGVNSFAFFFSSSPTTDREFFFSSAPAPAGSGFEPRSPQPLKWFSRIASSFAIVCIKFIRGRQNFLGYLVPRTNQFWYSDCGMQNVLHKEVEHV